MSATPIAQRQSERLVFAAVFALAAFMFLGGVTTAQAAPAPNGSYLQSCQKVRATARVLRAYCRTRDRRWVPARLDNHFACYGDIANVGGRLICREKPGDVVLFERSYFRGRQLAVDASATYLPRWFNDRTSSMRVRRGTWQVCEHTNYRGRCRVVRRDVADLNVLRLNDRISSLRRVRDAYEPPQGSYLRFCRNVAFDGRYITARCADRRGRWHDTVLDLRDCDRGDDIVVRDGELYCRGRRGGGNFYDDDDDRWDRGIPDRDDRGDRADRDDRDRDDRDRDDRDRGAGDRDVTLPSGSYRQTCRNARLDGDTLRAECRNREGAWRRSSLDIDKCRNDIVNDDGTLTCAFPPARPATPPAPPPPPPPSEAPPLPPSPSAPPPPSAPQGPYQQSCTNITVGGGGLSARCRTAAGGWRISSLDLRTCAQGTRIINDDGTLKCVDRRTPTRVPAEAPPPPPAEPVPPSPAAPPAGTQPGQAPPDGSYKATCRNIVVERRTLKAQCQATTGGNWIDSSIDLRTCRNAPDIANTNGQLTCAVPTPVVPPTTSSSGAAPTAPSPPSEPPAAPPPTSVPPPASPPPPTTEPPAAGPPPPTTPPATDTPPASAAPEQTGGTRPPPEGSYQKTCRNASVERRTLKAECQDAGGAWKQTSIDLRACRGADISNENGALTCAKSPP